MTIGVPRLGAAVNDDAPLPGNLKAVSFKWKKVSKHGDAPCAGEAMRGLSEKIVLYPSG